MACLLNDGINYGVNYSVNYGVALVILKIILNSLQYQLDVTHLLLLYSFQIEDLTFLFP